MRKRNSYTGKKLLVGLLVIAMVISSMGFAFANEAEGDAKTITILHTNDIHGRYVEGAYDGMGFGKIATLVNQYRSESGNVLLLDAGDTLHGLPFATMVEGESMVRVMDAIGYDAMASGNHDFNYGQERLVELNEMANFPILAANVIKEDGSLLLPSHIITEVDGVTIGIFGLATPETLFKSHPKGVEGLTFEDTLEAAERMVAELRDEVDVLIALGHLGIDEESYDTSIRVIENVAGIDIFVDGHSHSVFEEGMLVQDTLIVSAGYYGAYLGVVELTMEDGELVNKQASLISKADVEDLEEDEAIMDLIAEIGEEQDQVAAEYIGEAGVRLVGERDIVRTGESNLGNLITDVFIEATGAEVAFTNGGGIRTSIEAGAITRGDIIAVFPFGNSIEVKEVTGSIIKEILELGTDAYPESKGGFPHVAGIQYTIDLSREVGDRIVDIQVNGEPLELDRVYTMATNDFLAAGGDGYTMLVEIPTLRRLMAMDEALIDYIQARGTIAPEVEGRISVVEGSVVEEPVVEIPIVEEPIVEVPVVEEPVVEVPVSEIDYLIYIVQPNDWLSRIGSQYNVSWEVLQEINEIENADLIFPGQEIRIPVQ